MIPKNNTITVSWQRASKSYRIYIAGKPTDTRFRSIESAIHHLREAYGVCDERLRMIALVGRSLGQYDRISKTPYCGPYG